MKTSSSACTVMFSIILQKMAIACKNPSKTLGMQADLTIVKSTLYEWRRAKFCTRGAFFCEGRGTVKGR